jgi:hypothetical protein
MKGLPHFPSPLAGEDSPPPAGQVRGESPSASPLIRRVAPPSPARGEGIHLGIHP